MMLVILVGCGGGTSSLSQDERTRWERYRKLHPIEYSVKVYGGKQKTWTHPMGTYYVEPKLDRREGEKGAQLRNAQNLSIDDQVRVLIDMTSNADPEVLQWFFWEGTEVKSAGSPPDASLEKSLRRLLIEEQRNAR
jgi:hypothetical protein